MILITEHPDRNISTSVCSSNIIIVKQIPIISISEFKVFNESTAWV